MNNDQQPDTFNIWTPLYRTDLEILLTQQKYSKLHLYILYWLIWLPLLSNDELIRLLMSAKDVLHLVKTKKDLSVQVSQMRRLGLIDHVVLHEPKMVRHHRYYATDLGLYLYLSAVHSIPPVSIVELIKAYFVERNDLAARLATPHIHIALSELVTRLIAEGDAKNYPLLSYQQPWRHMYDAIGGKQQLSSDAALLIGGADETKHAFLVRVDTGPHFRNDKAEEQFLAELLHLRQSSHFYRQSWPGLLIITTQERIEKWGRLLLRSCQKQQISKPLSGAVTTIERLKNGVYEPIWWDLSLLPSMGTPFYALCVPLHQLLREPTSPELDELFSQQTRFQELLMLEASLPPPRTKLRLTRYVGESLQYEAAHLDAEMLEDLFEGKKKDNASYYGAGLLTIALTPMQKELLAWFAHHPLLDIPTLLAVLRPEADKQAMKLLYRQINRLFNLRLVETATQYEAAIKRHEPEQYLLTTAALRFMATRLGEPFSYYFVPQKDRQNENQMQRQLGTLGLSEQDKHTRGLYRFMGNLFKVANVQGEHVLEWKSAHESAHYYQDSFHQEDEPRQIRPDAELVVELNDGVIRRFYLEYDRATTGPEDYRQKFEAYASYELSTRMPLPLILVVTPSTKAASTIRQVLVPIRGYYGSLKVVVVLEQDVLAHGLTALLGL